MNYEDQEFDYRKPMPKKEKRRKKLWHRIQVLRNKKIEENRELVAEYERIGHKCMRIP